MADRPDTRSLVWPISKRLLTELGPVLVFVAGFLWDDLFVATAAFIIAVALATVVSWIRTRKLPIVPMVGFVIVVVFGGLTLFYGEEQFIKMRPTVINGVYALALAVAMLSGRNMMKSAFTPEVQISERGWRVLAWRTVAYLAVLAVANELVRAFASTEGWVLFKAAGIIPANLVFLLAQIPLIRAEWEGDEPAAAKDHPAYQGAG